VEKVFKARILEMEKKVSTNQKENRVSEDSSHGLGFGLPSSGPQEVLGHIEADDGLVETKAPLAQVLELQSFQIGPKKPGAIERGSNKKVKSLNRKKPHANAFKLGKENVGMCTSNLQKVNTMKEITRMELEEVDVGLK